MTADAEFFERCDALARRQLKDLEELRAHAISPDNKAAEPFRNRLEDVIGAMEAFVMIIHHGKMFAQAPIVTPAPEMPPAPEEPVVIAAADAYQLLINEASECFDRLDARSVIPDPNDTAAIAVAKALDSALRAMKVYIRALEEARNVVGLVA